MTQKPKRPQAQAAAQTREMPPTLAVLAALTLALAGLQALLH